MEVECRRRGMVTWADADAAIEAEREARWKRVETTTLMTALSLLVCAVWLAWPSLKGLVAGEGVALTAFGAPLLLVIWGIFIQDLTLDDPAARTRVGSASALAWPVLLVIGALGVEAALTQQLFGSVLICWLRWFCATLQTLPCVVILVSCATVPCSPVSGQPRQRSLR